MYAGIITHPKNGIHQRNPCLVCGPADQSSVSFSCFETVAALLGVENIFRYEL